MQRHDVPNMPAQTLGLTSSFPHTHAAVASVAFDASFVRSSFVKIAKKAIGRKSGHALIVSVSDVFLKCSSAMNMIHTVVQNLATLATKRATTTVGSPRRSKRLWKTSTLKVTLMTAAALILKNGSQTVCAMVVDNVIEPALSS